MIKKNIRLTVEGYGQRGNAMESYGRRRSDVESPWRAEEGRGIDMEGPRTAGEPAAATWSELRQCERSRTAGKQLKDKGRRGTTWSTAIRWASRQRQRRGQLMARN